MVISYTFRHMASSDALRSYVEQKLERLEKFVGDNTEVSAIFSSEKLERNFELVFTAPGPTLTVTETGEDMFAAIDIAIDKAERQLVRRKERRLQHH